MQIIKQSAELYRPKDLNEQEVLKSLEEIGRVCWKSEEKITDDSYKSFIKLLLSKNHLSVLEHIHITFHIITDRGVSHELARHRIINMTQESTRYVFPDKIILPVEFYEDVGPRFSLWYEYITNAIHQYNLLVSTGTSKQLARSILPHCVKTEIYLTANIREWLHIIELRTAPAAHPQMRELINQIKVILQDKLPLIFNYKETKK